VTWLVRGLLLVLIVVSVGTRSLAIRQRDATVGGFDVGSAIRSAVAARGYVSLSNPVKPPKVLSSVHYFERPGCAAPTLVMPFGISIEAKPLLHRAAGAGYNYRFIFLDAATSVQSRVVFYAEWLKHAALGIVGASPYLPLKVALAVADPVGCGTPDAIDWREVWRTPPASSAREQQFASPGRAPEG